MHLVGPILRYLLFNKMPVILLLNVLMHLKAHPYSPQPVLIHAKCLLSAKYDSWQPFQST